MPIDLFRKLCRDAADMGVGEMLITGGEPLIRRDFQEIVSILKEHNIPWSLNTATCPTSEQQKAIAGYPPEFVAVSLDGPSHVHNSFRGHSDAFDLALSSISFFSGLAETEVCAGTTITSHNLSYFEDTLSIVRKSGADRWGIHLLIPEGKADGQKDLFPSAKRMRSLLEQVVKARQHFPVTMCDEIGYAGEWEPYVRDEAFFCAAGKAMCAVLPDGSIMPCSTMNPLHLQGNVIHDSLRSIWHNSFSAQRTFVIKGECSSCKDIHVCKSGCWLQRTHGTQCCKHLWSMPESLKTAAGIALCVSTLAGCKTDTHSPTKDNSHASSQTPIHSATNSMTPATFDAVPLMKSPLIMKGIYGSKAGHRRCKPPSDETPPPIEKKTIIEQGAEGDAVNRAP